MERSNKTTCLKRAISILRDNEGASLVLVSIISIIVLTGIVILRMATSSLWASADKQHYQDQAYQAATSCGEALDTMIRNGKLTVADYVISTSEQPLIDTQIADLPNATIMAVAIGSGAADGDVTIKVTVNVGNSEYVYTAVYTSTGARKY
jgi:hypothetical protein